MLLFILKVDKDIIKIYNHKYIKVFPKYIINYSLKYHWGVSKPKRHYQVLKKSKLSVKYYFLLIFFLNSNEVICSFKVKSSKDITASKPILQLIHK